jgi:hypothetical protein
MCKCSESEKRNTVSCSVRWSPKILKCIVKISNFYIKQKSVKCLKRKPLLSVLYISGISQYGKTLWVGATQEMYYRL